MPLITPFFRIPGRWRRSRARRERMTVQLAILASIALMIIPLYIIYKPPAFVINWLQSRFPEVLFHVSTTKKVVALTIDDAPSQYTYDILHVLKANDARATFFAIGGQIHDREDVLQDMVTAGHEIGNHAMHDEPSINLPSETLRDEIDQVDELINKVYHAASVSRMSHYFRPGSGIFSRRLLEVANNAGYKTILGSIYPHDPFISLWNINAWHVLSSLRPGAIIICHDRRPWTLPMLEKVVPEIKRRGYEIVTISTLLDSVGEK